MFAQALAILSLLANSLRLLAIVISVVTLPASALAATTGEDAYQKLVESLSRIGVTTTAQSVQFDADSDVLTIEEGKLSFAGEVSEDTGDTIGEQIVGGMVRQLEFEGQIHFAKCDIEGLNKVGSHYRAMRWTCPTATSLEVDFKLDSQLRGTYYFNLQEFETDNLSFELPGSTTLPDNSSVDSWYPLIRRFLFASFNKLTVSSSGSSLFVYAIDGDDEHMILANSSFQKDLELLEAADGRLQHLSFEKQEKEGRLLSLTNSADIQSKKGPSRYEGLDYGALLNLFAPNLEPSLEEQPLLDSASEQDTIFSFGAAPGVWLDINNEVSETHGIAVLQKPVSPLALLSSFLRPQLIGGATGDDGEGTYLTSRVFSFARNFSYPDIKYTGTRFKLTDRNLDAVRRVMVDKIEITGANSNGLDEVAFSGIEAKNLPGGGTATVGGFKISNVEFADYSTLKAVIEAELASPGFSVTNPVEYARGFFPRSLGYELDSLEFLSPGLDPVRIGKANLSLATSVPPIPTSISLKSEDVLFPIALIQDEQVRQILEAVGLETIVWSDKAQLDWDEGSEELSLERLMLKVEGLGRVEVSARLANVSKALFEDPIGQGQSAALGAHLVDASLVFHDDGLTTKSLAHIAQQEGIAESEFLEVLVAQAAQVTAPIQNEAFTRLASDAASAFLKDPKRMKITLTPVNPVPITQILGSLAAPQSLPDLLNVNIVAN